MIVFVFSEVFDADERFRTFACFVLANILIIRW